MTTFLLATFCGLAVLYGIIGVTGWMLWECRPLTDKERGKE